MLVVCVWVPYESPVLWGEYDYAEARRSPEVPNYGFIWSPPVLELPPTYEDGPIRYQRASVDRERIVLELVAITAGFTAFLLVGSVTTVKRRVSQVRGALQRTGLFLGLGEYVVVFSRFLLGLIAVLIAVVCVGSLIVAVFQFLRE